MNLNEVFCLKLFGRTDCNFLVNSFLEPAPTFITQPSNPSFVDEGSNLTLRWTYNIDGTFREATFKRQISPSAITITAKDSNVVFVNPSYASRTQVAISDSETTVTLLGLNSSESGDYNFEVENTARLNAIANVKVTVRGKYSNFSASLISTNNLSSMWVAIVKINNVHHSSG